MITHTDASSALISTHRDSGYTANAPGGVSMDEPVQADTGGDESTQCRHTIKLLAFAAFMIALSIAGYFTADLLANKGESVKLVKPKDALLLSPAAPQSPQQGPPPRGQPLQDNAYPAPPQQQPPNNAADGSTAPDDEGLGLRVTNCGQYYDVSLDSELYESDISAVASYLQTYWSSFSTFVLKDVPQLSNGDAMDPGCLQQQMSEGEVVCQEMNCVYQGECKSKTDWGGVNLCKYMYFDMGGLRGQSRPDRRACLATMLVEQWSESCWEHDHIAAEMKQSTFSWWKTTFTVSDDWQLDNCPC